MPCLHVTNTHTSDEEKVLEQVIQDTEQISIEEEVGVAPVDEDDEESTSTQGVESGSVPSLLDEYTQRCVCVCVHVYQDE